MVSHRHPTVPLANKRNVGITLTDITKCFHHSVNWVYQNFEKFSLETGTLLLEQRRGRKRKRASKMMHKSSNTSQRISESHNSVLFKNLPIVSEFKILRVVQCRIVWKKKSTKNCRHYWRANQWPQATSSGLVAANKGLDQPPTSFLQKCTFHADGIMVLSWPAKSPRLKHHGKCVGVNKKMDC